MREFIDGAEEGLIVFSLGSFLSVTSIPRAIQKGISAAFKKLPGYRFAYSIVGAIYIRNLQWEEVGGIQNADVV